MEMDHKKFIRNGYAILAEYVEILDLLEEEIPPHSLERIAEFEMMLDPETGKPIISEAEKAWRRSCGHPSGFRRSPWHGDLGAGRPFPPRKNHYT
jgi:hypothetical protein